MKRDLHRIPKLVILYKKNLLYCVLERIGITLETMLL